jgi:hypothetical protein
MSEITQMIQPSLKNDPRSRAFADVADRLGNIDLNPLLIYKIATTLPECLPWLAEQFSVGGVAGYDWMTTDAERRHLVRNAVQLHRLKGTLEGYKTALRMTKTSTLESYIAPPDIPYANAPLTDAEWEHFLSQMPQVRLYRYDNQGVKQSAISGRRCFMVDSDERPGLKCFPMLTSARERFGERPFLWHPDGTVEEMRVWERTLDLEDRFSTTVDSVIKPGEAIGFFPVDYAEVYDRAEDVNLIGLRNSQGHPFLVHHDPMTRIYRLEFTTPYLSQEERLQARLITPSYEPLRVQYDAIAEPSVAYGMFASANMFPADSYIPPELVPPSEPNLVATQTTWNLGGSYLLN